MGAYIFRYSTLSKLPSVAIHKALVEADALGISVEGTPVVTSRRVPIPMLGPKTEFVIQFERATRVGISPDPACWTPREGDFAQALDSASGLVGQPRRPLRALPERSAAHTKK